MPPDLITACESIVVGSDGQMTSVVPVDCFSTGGMIFQVVEREWEGKVVSRKMAVVIFVRQQEPLFPRNVARVVSTICGECIERQLSAESNARGFLVDLTEVAICMTELTSEPGKLGKRHEGGRPRAVGVLPRTSSQGSFDSPCCNKQSMPLLSDLPAQAFGSGHIIANMRYKFGQSQAPDYPYRLDLFIFMLPAKAP